MSCPTSCPHSSTIQPGWRVPSGRPRPPESGLGVEMQGVYSIHKNCSEHLTLSPKILRPVFAHIHIQPISDHHSHHHVENGWVKWFALHNPPIVLEQGALVETHPVNNGELLPIFAGEASVFWFSPYPTNISILCLGSNFTYVMKKIRNAVITLGRFWWFLIVIYRNSNDDFPGTFSKKYISIIIMVHI